VNVSLLEILAAARAHAAPLAAESAGYLLLAVADHVALAPRVASADDVELLPDGSVRLRARRNGVASSESVEQALRRLLARALEVSSSVGPALRRAAERREETGLSSLVRELEVALIPVNRSAAKRALSRLHRETARARDAGKLDKWLKVQPEPVVAAPVVAAPVVAAPVVAAVEPLAAAADFPEESPVALPHVTSAPPAPVLALAPVLAPAPILTLSPIPAPAAATELTPEPLIAKAEPALTKPEPVVLRAKERGSSTPRLGTVVTAQTYPGEEADHTVRAPSVVFADEPELDLSIDVVIEPEQPEERVQDAAARAAAAQLLVDPEPSCMPDVLMAMVALHVGVDADDAPTRIRDVVTELRPAEPEAVVAPLTPAPDAVATPLTPEPAAVVATLTPEPQDVDDAWLTHSSLVGVVSAPKIFESERVDPAFHEAVTWNPGPVAPLEAAALPPALLIAEPAPELSPYAPAVLPCRSSDVSELLDSFYVSGATEERDLRSALKEMAGLELTPMPHPYVDEG
jgi:hypothetical protein